jgi:hypothetical protein
MNKLCLLYSINIIILLHAVLPSVAFSQSDSIPGTIRESALPEESGQKHHSLYTGLGAGSNLIYLGTSISNNKPYYAASVTYGFRNSLYATATASHLSETSPYIAFYNLAANYSHPFNSWFDISADIAVYKTAESLRDSLFSDFGYLNLTTGFDWKVLYTRISFSGIVSEANGFYLQISNSRYFETGEFLKGKALVSFDPDIEILFGNLASSETMGGMKRYGIASPFRGTKKQPAGSQENYSENFGLMDLQFSFPVTFSYGNFSIEAEAAYLLPVYSDPLYPEPKGFTFYLNALFKIF